MKLLSRSCEICGGDLQKIEGDIYKCICCKNEFAIDEAPKISEKNPPSTGETIGTITKKFFVQKLDELKSGNLTDMISFPRKQSEEGGQAEENNERGVIVCSHQSEVAKSRRIVRIEIPRGTTAIDEGAFENCVNLESIVIPDTVTHIGASAFKECRKLASITIPPSVVHIGAFAFQNCVHLKRILFPQSVQVIDVGALSGCSGLESVTIPFVGVTCESEYARYKNWSDLGYSSIKHFGAIFGAHDYVEQGSVIPQKLAGVSIAGGFDIDEHAFWGCGHIKKVTISKSVTFIGKNAFFGCKMLRNIIFIKTSTWKKWDIQDSRGRRPSHSIFGDLMKESVPECILSNPEKAAKALTKKYCNVCLVSK